MRRVADVVAWEREIKAGVAWRWAGQARGRAVRGRMPLGRGAFSRMVTPRPSGFRERRFKGLISSRPSNFQGSKLTESAFSSGNGLLTSPVVHYLWARPADFLPRFVACERNVESYADSPLMGDDACDVNLAFA